MTNDTWGLNFTSPIDAKQFRECCVSMRSNIFLYLFLSLAYTKTDFMTVEMKKAHAMHESTKSLVLSTTRQQIIEIHFYQCSIFLSFPPHPTKNQIH
jgi:hypothetical protein